MCKIQYTQYGWLYNYSAYNYSMKKTDLSNIFNIIDVFLHTYMHGIKLYYFIIKSTVKIV